MAWSEVAARRTQSAKVFTDGSKYKAVIHSGTVLHFEATPDNGVFDQEVNMTSERVTNPSFDGWMVENAGWHYALGKDIANHGQQDGWIGFGGRGGQNWFKFRLLRAGYLHWPTRSWQDVGGTPIYNRANLKSGTDAIIHEDGAVQVVQSKATWSGIWNTPDGGDVSVRWRAEGRGLKEEIILNQAAREWIAVNRTPTTAPKDTFFGFVFQLDIDDIPRWARNEALLDIDGDINDDDGAIELRDTADRLLGLLPIDYAWSEGDPTKVIRLKKRIWRDGDGNHYLLVGAMVPDLNSLPDGDIVFDPSTEITASTPNPYIEGTSSATWATARGTSANYGSTTITCGGSQRDGNYKIYRGFLRFDTSGLSGYTITDVKMRLTLSVLTGSNDDQKIAEYDWSEWAGDLSNSTKRETAWDGLISAAASEAFQWANTSVGTNTPTESTDSLSNDWINDSGYTYYGFLNGHDALDNPPADGYYYRHWICTASHGTASYRPILVVEYTTSTTHDLTVQDASSASAAEAPSLGYVHNLAVGDANSAAVLDSVTAGLVHSLIVAGLLSGASLDTAATTLIHSLSVEDAASAATLDSTAVALVHNLIVAGLLSGSGLDGVSTTLFHTLTVSDLSSASEIDNAAVAMVHSLVVASLQSASSLDEVAVYLFDGIVLLTALARGRTLTAEERSLVLTALRRSLGLTAEERR